MFPELVTTTTAKMTFEKLLGQIAIRFNLLQVCPSVPFCIDVSVGSGLIFDPRIFGTEPCQFCYSSLFERVRTNFFLPVSALKWLFSINGA